MQSVKIMINGESVGEPLLELDAAPRKRPGNRAMRRAAAALLRRKVKPQSPAQAFVSEEMRQACRKARGYQAKAPKYTIAGM